MIVPAPMFISSRLMAALRIDEGSETGGTIHISHDGTSREGRQRYSYVIEDAAGTVLDEGSDLSSGVGDEADYGKAMATLLSFLTAAAESYEYELRGGDSDNSDLFAPAAMEWAYMNSDELSEAEMELEPED